MPRCARVLSFCWVDVFFFRVTIGFEPISERKKSLVVLLWAQQAPHSALPSRNKLAILCFDVIRVGGHLINKLINNIYTCQIASPIKHQPHSAGFFAKHWSKVKFFLCYTRMVMVQTGSKTLPSWCWTNSAMCKRLFMQGEFGVPSFVVVAKLCLKKNVLVRDHAQNWLAHGALEGLLIFFFLFLALSCFARCILRTFFSPRFACNRCDSFCWIENYRFRCVCFFP